MTATPHRYHRQALLPEIAEQGQARLGESAALLVGCGALGTHLADTLVRAGVGCLVVVDRDFVELTNLQRQVLFDERDVEEVIPKAEAAGRKLRGINSQVDVRTVVDDVNAGNIERLVMKAAGRPVDVIVDGLDNFETRFLLNDAAVRFGIPYVYGGAVGTTGSVFSVLPHTATGDRPWELEGLASPCLRCLFETVAPPGLSPTCDTAGVLGPTVAMVASLQATETLKILLGAWDAINRDMVHIDSWSNDIQQLRVERAYEIANCPACKGGKFEYLDGEQGTRVTTLCGRDAVQLSSRSSAAAMDFEAIAGRLRAHGEVKINPYLLRAEVKDRGHDFEISLFKDGRAIIRGTRDAGVARGIVSKFIGA